jgi:hypothetical protein
MATPAEVELRNVLATTVRYFQQSRQLDRDATQALLRSLSDSSFFREVWPDVSEDRRTRLVDEMDASFDFMKVSGVWK